MAVFPRRVWLKPYITFLTLSVGHFLDQRFFSENLCVGYAAFDSLVSSDYFMVFATIRAKRKLMRKRLAAGAFGKSLTLESLLNILRLLRWRMYMTQVRIRSN